MISLVCDNAIISDKALLKEALKTLPKSLYKIIEERWKLYLKNFNSAEEYYKNIICCMLFLGKINWFVDGIGLKFKEEGID